MIFISGLSLLWFLSPSFAIDYTCPNDRKNSTVGKLQSCLLKNYDKTLKPESHHKLSVEVFIDLSDIALVNNYIFMYAWTFLYWYDDRLAWDSDLYDGVKLITIPSNSLWIPPLYTNDNKGTYTPLIKSMDVPNDDVYIDNFGTVNQVEMSVLYGQCHDVDFSHYPFDVHNCTAFIYTEDETIQYEIVPIDSFKMNEKRRYREFYDIVQDLKTSIREKQTSANRAQKVLEFNIIFKRHSSMHAVMLHFPAFGFLIFNFISLWLPNEHLMKLFLPILATFGTMYQIQVIDISLLRKSYITNMNLISADKPLHIVLLYRNIIILSIILLLQNVFISLLNLNRKMLVSLLVEYSDIIANSYKSERITEEEEIGTSTSSVPTNNEQLDLPTTQDYVIITLDGVIVMFIIYNFMYVVYLLLQK